MLDFGLYLFYALLIIAVVAAFGFSIVNALKIPGALVKSLIGIGILLVLFGISYALSGSEVSNTNAALGITESSSKLIGAGLIMFYITLSLSALALIYSEINKALK